MNFLVYGVEDEDEDDDVDVDVETDVDADANADANTLRRPICHGVYVRAQSQ